MSDSNRGASGGMPPGGGRWDHDTMRNAAERPATGPGSTDTLAASGGLELPAHESHPAALPDHTASEPIPGERDATTLTDRWPGAMAGRPSGSDLRTSHDDSMDDATRRDRELEGGGAPRSRR